MQGAAKRKLVERLTVGGVSSLVGAEAVVRLERDAFSMVK